MAVSNVLFLVLCCVIIFNIYAVKQCGKCEKNQKGRNNSDE